ncbi:MAG: ZIP family metal transporter [Gemmatimonadota bacterium]
MTPAQQSLVAVGVASAIPVLGTLLFAAGAQRFVGWIPRLVPFAAGAIVGAALFHIVPEALERSSRIRVAVTVLAGMALFGLAERLTHGSHTHHTGEGGAARRLLPLSIASDALHNLIDGVLIATTFLTEPALGVITAIAVATHELPRELATFALCIAGGLSIGRALVVNAATAAVALLGALAVIMAGEEAADAAAQLLPFAGGAFLYLAGTIVWVDGTRLESGRNKLWYATLVAAGIVTAAALS